MATIPTPDSYAIGEKVTAAKLNKNIRDAENFLLSPPLLIVENRSGTFSVPNNANTTVTFDTAVANTDNMWASGGTITIVTAGIYEVHIRESYASNASGVRVAQLTVNGTTDALKVNVAPAPGAVSIVTGSALWRFSAGDTLALIAFQNSGVALTTAATVGQAPGVHMRWVAK